VADLFQIVKAYFSPSRDCVDNVIGFMDRTKKTLDVAIYSLTQKEIIGALERTSQRGIKVRMVVDADQYKSVTVMKEAIAGLQKLGCDIRVDKQSGYMHNKYSISDLRGRQPAVLTGSYNFTAHATKVNRENLVRIRNKMCVKQFQDNFEEIWKRNE